MNVTVVSENELNITLSDEQQLDVSLSQVEPSLSVEVCGLITSLFIDGRVIIQKVAGETIGSHKIVKLGDDSKVYYADCRSLPDVERILGMTLNSANANGSVNILLFGKLQDSSFNFDTSKPIYLGKNGNIVQDIDNESVFIQRLGRVLKNNEILIDLDEPIIL